MPLVIYCLGSGHTDTSTNIPMSRTKVILRNQVHTSLRLAHTWFKKDRYQVCCTEESSTFGVADSTVQCKPADYFNATVLLVYIDL